MSGVVAALQHVCAEFSGPGPDFAKLTTCAELTSVRCSASLRVACGFEWQLILLGREPLAGAANSHFPPFDTAMYTHPPTLTFRKIYHIF